jgi:hypothetical protein
VIARLGLSPLEEKAQQLYHNVPALAFIDHWQNETAEDQYKRLGKILGVYWTIEDAAALFKEGPRSRKRPRELWQPLTFIMQPELDKAIRNYFGSPRGIHTPGWVPRRDEEVVDGYDMGVEEFKQFAGMFTHLIPKGT